jgi:hypothetical protein
MHTGVTCADILRRCAFRQPGPREERGLTQGALAAAARVGVATISRLESRGVRDERVYVQVRRALDVSEADITGWIAARVIDRRLMPLVIWFAELAPRDQDALAQLMRLLPHRG